MNERVRRLRERLGMSQEALGEALGIGRSAVSRIENGKNTLTEQNIKLLCQMFGVNREWLLTGKGEMMAAIPSGELAALARRYELREKDYVLIEKLLKMSPRERDGIFRFMQDVMAGVSELGEKTDAPVAWANGPGPDAGGVRYAQDMTGAELHAELDRQLAEEKEAAVGL